jgi:hypothetical protein
MATPRPYGRGPYGTSVYAGYREYETAGSASLALTTDGTLARTWQQPAALCSAGTWTRVLPPSRVPDDQQEAA